MKKIKAVIVFLTMLQSLLAQTDDLHGFAIIKDKDGFTNIREKPNATSKIVGKIKEDELFYYFLNEDPKDWYSVYFDSSNPKDYLEGFVHKSRIKPLSSFMHIKYKKAIKDTLFFKNDSIDAKIISNKFIPKQHKIEKKDNFIYKIDGKEPYGRDGGVPNTGIKSIEIKIGDALVAISQNELKDLFQPSFVMPNIYIGQNDMLYLVMSGGDGAGYYEVAFAIKDKKYVKRYIFRGF